jgi:hypothetical protein
MSQQQTRNQKLSTIADMQSALNKRMKKWCSTSSNFIEKRSVPNGDSKVFQNLNGDKFTINKEKVKLFSTPEITIQVEQIIRFFDKSYSMHSKSIKNQDELYSINQGIKFIFYGLHYINEETVELQYGFSNIIDDVDNIEYI